MMSPTCKSTGICPSTVIVTSLVREGRIVMPISPRGLTTIGRLERENAFIRVRTRASRSGSMIGPPALAE